MNRINLDDYLKKSGKLYSGIIAQSKLIDKLEIVGFVNACKDEDMYEGSINLCLNGIFDMEPKSQIILSNNIYQVTTHYNGREMSRCGRTIPIFNSLVVSEAERKYKVEDLYIPSLVGNQLYRKIKSRYGSGYKVSESELRRSKFPSNIKAVDEIATLNAPASHIQLLDKDGVTKSIGENIMVVCRYLHAETGAMCYTQYNLNEVFVDDED